MVRLIVDEAGERRAFRVGHGVLKVGTGEQARLKLQSSGVAEVHAEIEVSREDGTVTLRPSPGVKAPLVDGVAVEEPVKIEFGIGIEIGQALIWVEDDASNEHFSPQRTVGQTGAGAGATPADQALRKRRQEDRRRSAIAAAGRHSPRSKVRRSQPRVQRGLPGWAIGAIVIGVAAVGLLVITQGFLSEAAQGTAPVEARIAAAKEFEKEGAFNKAIQRLDLIPADSELTQKQKTEIEAIRGRIRERREAAEQDVINLRGTDFKNVLLVKYEQRHLQGAPEPHKVRLFLERCAEFEERWPKHPDLDWVRRQRSRFEGQVDMSAPLTYLDIEWKVDRLVGPSPRNYKLALQMLDSYIREHTGEDVAKAREKQDQLWKDREEYSIDRLQQARFEYEKKKNANTSIWWLVHSVIWLGDKDMEDEAAEFLVKMPDLEGHLRGYESKYPDKYAALMQNSVVRAWAKKAGML